MADSLTDYVRENRSGLVTDLVFAVVWVTIVTVVFEILDGPDWAYYAAMLAGVVAYFGFFASLEVAKRKEN